MALIQISIKVQNLSFIALMPVSDKCFDRWYAGCRPGSMANCRNQIATSRSTFQQTGRKRIAFAAEINKRIEHLSTGRVQMYMKFLFELFVQTPL